MDRTALAARTRRAVERLVEDLAGIHDRARELAGAATSHATIRADRVDRDRVTGLRTRYARWVGEAGLLVSLLAPDRLERFREQAGRLRDLLALADQDGVGADRHRAALARRVGELRNVLRAVPPAVDPDG